MPHSSVPNSDPTTIKHLKGTTLSWLRVSNLALRRLRHADVILESDTNRLLRQTRLGTNDPDTDSASWHQAEQMLADTHLTLLAYAHIETSVQLLLQLDALNQSQVEAASRFLTVFESGQASDLRNILEHQEEYVVGVGRKQDLLKQRRYSFGVGVESSLPEGSVSVTLGSLRFDLHELEQASLNLWLTLNKETVPTPAPKYHESTSD